MAQLFQPTNITPDTRGAFGNGVIVFPSVWLDYPTCQVSWQVNGNTAMTAFKIDFYKNDGSGDLLWSTGKLTDGCPFYGTDQNGEVTLFSYTVPDLWEITGDPVTVTEGQMKITQWWGSDPNNYVVQASPSVFIVRNDVESEIYYNGSVVTPQTVIPGRSATFTGSFYGLGNDGLMWVRWRLTDGENVIADTGKLYGAVELSFSYDGFLPGTYYISLDGETDSGVSTDANGSSEWKFSVSYDMQETGVNLSVCKAAGGESAVEVSWPAIRSIPLSESTGNYSISGGGITIETGGGSLLWDTVNGNAMSIPPDWTFAVKVVDAVPPSRSTAPLFRISFPNKNSVSQYLQANFSYARALTFFRQYVNASGTTITGNSYSFVVPQGQPFYIFLSGTGIYIAFNNGSGYKISKVPGFTVDPTFWASLPVASAKIGTCSGQYAFAKIISGFLSKSEMLSKFVYKDGDVYDVGTLFLAPGENGSDNAGNVEIAGMSGVNGVALYRKGPESSSLFFVTGVAGVGASSVLDYGARSQQGPYQYYLYLTGSDAYVSYPAISAEIDPCFWDWTVLSCSEDGEGGFSVNKSYLFGKNFSSGPVSNGNKPNILENFTPYPLVQFSPANYKSGTLQSLIGTIDYAGGENEYSDSLSLKEEIYAMSTTTDTLFLKSRKGDLWQIRPGGEITMETADGTRAQAQTVRFPWVETGDADGVSVYRISGG